MLYLWIVSFVWAFSFGLIKGNLAGVDSNLVAFLRMLLSLALFAPLLRPRRVPGSLAIRLAGVGAVQFGVMYAAYIASYRHLQAHEVALYTVFTPIYVALLEGALGRRRRRALLLPAVLAVAGAWIVLGGGDPRSAGLRHGFLLVQISNLAFALGQVAYRRILRGRPDLRDREVFGFLYLGAVVVTAGCAAVTARPGDLALEPREIATLLYLGLLASGVCFFLWNLGARRARPGALAVVNNLKVPLAVACSLLVFGERADLGPLLLGGGLVLGALALADRRPSPPGVASGTRILRWGWAARAGSPRGRTAPVDDAGNDRERSSG